MKIKILTPNANGNFEFTKSDLEKLLKEAYDDGYYDGVQSSCSTTVQPTLLNKPWWNDATYSGVTSSSTERASKL